MRSYDEGSSFELRPPSHQAPHREMKCVPVREAFHGSLDGNGILVPLGHIYYTSTLSLKGVVIIEST